MDTQTHTHTHSGNTYLEYELTHIGNALGRRAGRPLEAVQVVSGENKVPGGDKTTRRVSVNVKLIIAWRSARTYLSFHRENSRSRCCHSRPRLIGPVMDSMGILPASSEYWKKENKYQMLVLTLAEH